jgi:hypothetical protein
VRGARKWGSHTHVLIVIEESMSWSRKQGGAHQAVTQARKEYIEEGNPWAYVQACMPWLVWWDTVSK